MKSVYSMYFNASDMVIKLARELRLHPTEAEKTLWRAINKGQLGLKFRRQHPIYNFIADFYCHEARLIVEVDGGYHKSRIQRERDESRSAEVALVYDLKVIRFTNEEVLSNTNAVVSRLKTALSERMKNQLGNN
ncbi:endonuclease domain-containing protein [Williamwhitmania taraxaci]|uniref:Leucyl-tRNA synthetase/cyclase n=1 Tax=Williamwhitmania taraxaci TaxID=1640674 RepID=A0A1G6R8C9_9BACT|nr:endonuclease domain-containing protein [Williamwhitmania taraxaci]SDD00146.1 leucyl-tRNA synthetase/cyclase [Williamwhitmania taraxaci]